MKNITKYFLTLISLPMFFLADGQEYRSVLENTTFVQFTNTNTVIDKKATSKGDDPYDMPVIFSLDSLCFQNFLNFDGIQYANYKSIRNYSYPNKYIWLLGEEINLRESEDHSKLYSRYNLYDFYEEVLIYDISLEIGDTFSTQIFYYENQGVAGYIETIDTVLTVDSIFYINNKKVVRFNYYQQFGPFSHYFEFIEGIGPNYGIIPLVDDGYHYNLWSSLLRTYVKEALRYNYKDDTIYNTVTTPYYSNINNTGWGHYLAKGEIDSWDTYDDPFETNLEQGFDSLVLKSTYNSNNYIRAELRAEFSNNVIYLTQTSNCTRLFSNINDTSLNTSKLIYDISLEKGDTFKTSVYIKTPNDYWVWVDTTLTVDSVYYQEGRKIVSLDYWQVFGPFSFKYLFIESIGPNYGLFPLGEKYQYKFGRLTSVYNSQNIRYKYVPYLPTNTQQKNLKNLRIYPNPTYGMLYLEDIHNKSTHVEVFKINGELIQKIKLASNRINIQNLNPGLYILKIYEKDQITYALKIIKL